MRNAKEGVASYASLLIPHCPVTVVQRYRDGVCSLLFHLFFIICHPHIPLLLVLPIFLLAECTIKTMLEYRCKNEMCVYTCNSCFLFHSLPSLLIHLPSLLVLVFPSLLVLVFCVHATPVSFFIVCHHC